MPIFGHKPVDWSRPVQWSDGTPCEVERVSGFILASVDPNSLPKGFPVFADKFFKDTYVVYEDDGSICGAEDSPMRLHNVGDQPDPIEELFNSF